MPSINVIYPNKDNVFMVPNQDKKEIITCIYFVIIDEKILIPKKWWKEKHFLSNQSINIIYPNDKNVFMVPIMEKKRFLNASMFVTIDEITLIPKNW